MISMEAIVLYDYAARDTDELTLKKGDTIAKVQVRDSGWWEGCVGKDGKRGLFPSNYVKVISENVNSSSTAGTPLCGKKFKVKYNYAPKHQDELALQVNDVIEVLSEVEEGWWEGKLGNQIGVFPSNFVTELIETAELPMEKDSHKSSLYINPSASADSNPADADEKVPSKATSVTNDVLPALPPKPKQEMCIALYPYEAKHEDELTLKEDDVIVLLSTDLPDQGWWKGQLNGKVGVFPDNFVKLISMNDSASKPERPQSAKSSVKLRESSAKQTNSNVAAFRKSLEATVKLEDPSNVTKKPVVLKKPSLSSTSLNVDGGVKVSSMSQAEKVVPSPERSINTSIVLEQSPVSKPEPERSNSASPSISSKSKLLEKRLSFEEKLSNALAVNLAVNLAAKEQDRTDGLSASKVYKVANADSDRLRNDMNVQPAKAENVPAEGGDLDLNTIERSELLTHPTASRAKAPKRRPPSGINFKEEDIIPVNHRNAETPKNVVTVNGTADLGHDKAKSAPWVQELKLSQAKKSSAQVNLKSGFTSTGCNVTFRYQRPVSMFSGEADGVPYSFQPKPAIATATSAEVTAANTSTTAVNAPAFVTVGASAEKSDGVTISLSLTEWNALNEKVNNLEHRLEMQNEVFKKSVEQLRMRLAKEMEQRLEMKNEIDKLMDLVTQV